jgi:hypothetical protein
MMTKTERNKIKDAIWFLTAAEVDGGDFNKGMDMLCEVAGLPYTKLTEGKAVSLFGILAKPAEGGEGR